MFFIGVSPAELFFSIGQNTTEIIAVKADFERSNEALDRHVVRCVWCRIDTTRCHNERFWRGQ
jgi:hypothetical protein